MTTQDGRARTSKQRYLRFVEDYQKGLLDDQVDAAKGLKPAAGATPAGESGQPSKASAWLVGQRREYLRSTSAGCGRIATASRWSLRWHW